MKGHRCHPWPLDWDRHPGQYISWKTVHSLRNSSYTRLKNTCALEQHFVKHTFLMKGDLKIHSWLCNLKDCNSKSPYFVFPDRGFHYHANRYSIIYLKILSISFRVACKYPSIFLTLKIWRKNEHLFFLLGSKIEEKSVAKAQTRWAYMFLTK